MGRRRGLRRHRGPVVSELAGLHRGGVRARRTAPRNIGFNAAAFGVSVDVRGDAPDAFDDAARRR